MSGNHYLDNFEKKWRKKHAENGFDEIKYEELTTFNTYKKNLKKSKLGGSDDQILKILS